MRSGKGKGVLMIMIWPMVARKKGNWKPSINQLILGPRMVNMLALWYRVPRFPGRPENWYRSGLGSMFQSCPRAWRQLWDRHESQASRTIAAFPADVEFRRSGSRPKHHVRQSAPSSPASLGSKAASARLTRVRTKAAHAHQGRAKLSLCSRRLPAV